MREVIRARGLVKRYGDRTAVAEIDFSVAQGECFGLLGCNGAGKTSTIRMISCVSPVTAGELLVEGMSVERAPRAIKAIIGVVPQDDNLDTDLNVLGNLLAHARYFGLGRAEAQRRAREALEFMELAHRAQSAIDTLSGGMRRRLLIARALLNQPKVLVLDEPTTGLDPHARHLVWQRVRELKRQGTTMVLSTHYMDEATHLCDRLVILEQGRILDGGTPRELIARHVGGEVVELRLAPWDKERVLPLLAGAARRIADSGDSLLLLGVDGRLPDLGLEHSAVIRRPPNLEDVFLLLAGKGLDTE